MDRHLYLGSEFMQVVLAFFHPVPFHAWLLMPWGGGPTVTPAGIIPWWDEKGTGGGGTGLTNQCFVIRWMTTMLCHVW